MEDRQQHKQSKAGCAGICPADYALLFVVPAGDGCFVIWIDTMRRQQYGVAMPALFGAVWDRRSGICPEQAQKSVFDFGRYRAVFAVLHGWACFGPQDITAGKIQYMT